MLQIVDEINSAIEKEAKVNGEDVVDVFSVCLNIFKKKYAEVGEPPESLAFMFRDNRLVAIAGLRFRDDFEKNLVFRVFLPATIYQVMPETCVAVLPSVMRVASDFSKAQDVLLVVEINPVEQRVVALIKKSSDVEVLECKEFDMNLLEEALTAMQDVWVDSI